MSIYLYRSLSSAFYLHAHFLNAPTQTLNPTTTATVLNYRLALLLGWRWEPWRPESSFSPSLVPIYSMLQQNVQRPIDRHSLFDRLSHRARRSLRSLGFPAAGCCAFVGADQTRSSEEQAEIESYKIWCLKYSQMVWSWFQLCFQ